MKRALTILSVLAVVAVGGVAALYAQSGSQTIGPATMSTTAEQTVTFAVENMFCELCPVTVKTAMERVEGVKTVSVSFERMAAVVVFDPALATPEEIAAASTGVGYPAHATES